jgi:hypothetical protein
MSKMGRASVCVDHHRITLGGNAHSAMIIDNTAKELDFVADQIAMELSLNE